MQGHQDHVKGDKIMNHFVMRLNGYYWNDNVGWVSCMDQASLYNMKPSITYRDTQWVQTLYISGNGNQFTISDLVETINLSKIYEDLQDSFSQDIVKEVLLQYLLYSLIRQEPRTILEEAYDRVEMNTILSELHKYQNMRTNKFTVTV